MRWVRVRRGDDPWWTALYLYPHTMWWAPGLVIAILTFALNLLVWDNSLLASAAIGCLVGGLNAYLCRGALD